MTNKQEIKKNTNKVKKKVRFSKVEYIKVFEKDDYDYSDDNVNSWEKEQKRRYNIEINNYVYSKLFSEYSGISYFTIEEEECSGFLYLHQTSEKLNFIFFEDGNIYFKYFNIQLKEFACIEALQLFLEKHLDFIIQKFEIIEEYHDIKELNTLLH